MRGNIQEWGVCMHKKVIAMIVLAAMLSLGVSGIALAGRLCPTCGQYTIDVHCSGREAFTGPPTECSDRPGCRVNTVWYYLVGNCTNCSASFDPYMGQYHSHIVHHSICSDKYVCSY